MRLRDRLVQFWEPFPHSSLDALATILSGKTSLSSSGFPYLAESSFRTFLQEVPHLFQDGSRLLQWCDSVESALKAEAPFSRRERESIERALKVLRNVIFSASICAPSDLWILKHVLSAHLRLGLFDLYRSGDRFTIDSAAARFSLHARHLSWDFSLLHCRGYLDFRNRKYAWSSLPQAQDILLHASEVPEKFFRDLIDAITSLFNTAGDSDASEFLTLRADPIPAKNWCASHYQMEIGYRLVPLVLAIHSLKKTPEILQAARLVDVLPHLPSAAAKLLHEAGITCEDGSLTTLGRRVLERGPGPFGIIHAYTNYMRELTNQLSGSGAQVRVDRLKNIAASQDANRKTFLMANDALDRFSSECDFHYTVFIEHALGQGEATRQRRQRAGEAHLHYFGADLEDAAIDRAIELQKQNVLPANMIFIRRADIGQPSFVIEGVSHAGFATEGSVMFVGNGFHEIRGQTNEKITDVFRQYCDAGILVVFTEESALSDHDLLSTGWNTYHAGFRYVHELSGQGLRPVYGTDKYGRHSWRICASLGGYAVLTKYCAHTRTIYPFPRKGGYNPPISMTYFCVPNETARRMGFFPANWGKTEYSPRRTRS
jgi:hypothetical protein